MASSEMEHVKLIEQDHFTFKHVIQQLAGNMNLQLKLAMVCVWENKIIGQRIIIIYAQPLSAGLHLSSKKAIDWIEKQKDKKSKSILHQY